MRTESEVARYLDGNAYAAGAGWDEDHQKSGLHMFRE